MTKANTPSPKIQFLLTEEQLKDLYTAINFAPGDATIRSQLLLSKPERENRTIDEVYEDCYLLSLHKENLDTLITKITNATALGAGRAATIVQSALQRGAAKRK